MDTQHANIFDVLIAWTPIISIVASAAVAVFVPYMLSKMSKSMTTKLDDVKAEVVGVKDEVGVVKNEQVHLFEKVEEVHQTTNSKMEEFIKEAKEASRLGGMQEQRNETAASDALKAQGAAAATEKKPGPETT